MAARKKAARKIRQKGDALPKMIDSDRVLRALKGTMTEKQFIKAYDEAAGKKGGGLKTPPAKLVKAYETFEKDGDFDAFAKSLGLDSQRATTAMGRIVRWNATRE